MGTMALPRRPGSSSTEDHLFQNKLFMKSQNQIEGDPCGPMPGLLPDLLRWKGTSMFNAHIWYSRFHKFFVTIGLVVLWIESVGQVELPTGRVEPRPNADTPYRYSGRLELSIHSILFYVLFLQIITKWRCFTGISLICVSLKEICVCQRMGWASCNTDRMAGRESPLDTGDAITS